MALSGRLVSVLVGRFLCLLLSCSLSYGTESDNYFKSSWNFSNNANKGFICEFTGVQCWESNLDKYAVSDILLSDMGLKGQFPRGIQNCSYLRGLNLSNNELFGSIPQDIATLFEFGAFLDLSSNNFSGEIPENLADCSRLNALKLDHNRSTGQIPARLGLLLDRIVTFNVSYNLLSGPVPTVNATFAADSYANNLGLYGGPLERCQTPSRTRKSLTIVIVAGAVGGAFGSGIGMFFLLRGVSKEEGRQTRGALRVSFLNMKYTVL